MLGSGRRWFGIAVFTVTVSAGCEPIEPQIDPVPTALGIQWSCLMFPAGSLGGTPNIVPVTPPLTHRQFQFTLWFNRTAIAANPQMANVYVPFATLANMDNALANPGYVALNPNWFARIGDIAATGVFAHELGHIAQFYRLVPVTPPVGTQFEGQADYVSGWMLRQSGVFSLADAQQYAVFIRTFGGAGSSTHPPGTGREQLFWAGYNSM